MVTILTEDNFLSSTPLKKHLFYIEDDGPFVGYGEGSNNKYDEPLFTKEVCDEIITHYNLDVQDTEYPDNIVTYDLHKDVFRESNPDDPYDYRIYAGRDYNTVDGILHLYPFGSPDWIWRLSDDYDAYCDGCGDHADLDYLTKTDRGWLCPSCIDELDSHEEMYRVFYNADYWDEHDIPIRKRDKGGI